MCMILLHTKFQVAHLFLPSIRKLKKKFYRRHFCYFVFYKNTTSTKVEYFLKVSSYHVSVQDLQYVSYCRLPVVSLHILHVGNADLRKHNGTYIELTPWRRVLLEKPTGSQLVKKFPPFYGSRRFIAASTRPRHLSLSSARSIQSMLRPFHFLKMHLNIITPSTPGSSKWCTSVCLPSKTCIHLSCPMCATCPAHFNLDLLT